MQEKEEGAPRRALQAKVVPYDVPEHGELAPDRVRLDLARGNHAAGNAHLAPYPTIRGVAYSGAMAQQRIRAVYMRGGTSRCLVFHDKDLPEPGAARDRILLAALGSPDPYGRQLNGLGGGISSLSKAVVIGPASRPDADVDYTFGQV